MKDYKTVTIKNKQVLKRKNTMKTKKKSRDVSALPKFCKWFFFVLSGGTFWLVSHFYEKKKLKKETLNDQRKRRQRNISNYFEALFRLCKVSAVVLLIGAVGFMGYSCFGYLSTSPYFHVEQIIVSGEKKVSEIEVLNLAKIDSGSNIFAISLRKVSERIEQHPWVEKALVRRMLPQRIFIDITERAPFAMINLDRLYLVDKKGTIFKEVGPEDLSDIPVLTGLESKDLAANESVSKNLVQKALSLIDTVNTRNILDGDEVSEVNMDPYSGLSLFTLREVTQIKLGFDDYEQKLDYLQKVMTDLDERYKKAEYINLIYKEKAYVKMSDKETQRTLVAFHETKRR